MQPKQQRLMLAGLVLTLMVNFASGQAMTGGNPEESIKPAPVTQEVNAPTNATEVPAYATEGAVGGEDGQPLVAQVELLKQAVLELNRDLLILEEELLFPANTQIAIFLSMDVGEFFQLDAVKIKIDDQLVASSLYTPQQTDALFRGGVQRLFVGNLKSGSHVITAVFTGKGPEGREYKRGATTIVEKKVAPKMLELRIVDSTKKLQPVFDIKEWEL
jgi:hypothetical protein